MNNHRKNTNWPYVAILLCLLALSVTAPRHWRNFVNENGNRLDLAVSYGSEATPAPTTIAQPAAAIAAQSSPAAVEVVGPTLASAQPDFSSAPSSGRAVSPTVETVREPSTLDKSPRLEPAAHAPDKPALVSAADKITRLATVELLPRSDRSLSIPLLLAQPSAASDPGGIDPGGIEGSPIAPALSLPPCVALIEQLEAIDINGTCSLWAYETIDLLEQMATLDADDREAIDDTLESLRQAAAGADREIDKIDDQDGASQLRHARYALVRRVDLWQQAFKSGPATDDVAPTSAEIRQEILRSVDEVALAAKRTKIAASWGRYLMLDKLRSLAAESGDTAVVARRQVARRQASRRVLSRTESSGLSSDQRKFVASRSVISLKTHLQHWAALDVDTIAMLADVEQFEQARSSDVARRVAQAYQDIRFSRLQSERELAARVEEHYRNANVRLAVTDRFLNLMLPRVESKLGTVNDNILGNPVRGKKFTKTELRMRFLPSHRRLRFALEAHGEVHSRTTASNSRATLYNRGMSRYRAGKLLQVGPRGMRMWPAVAEVQSSSELENVETNYDGTLFGSIARGYVRDQHSQMHAEAMEHVDRKVRREATGQLDAIVDTKIEKFKEAFSKHIMDPLKHLSLRPQPVQLVTTTDRMVSRVRLATVNQLAAFTPRPRAPRDSLLSLQIHESAPGNIIEQLDLDGRTFTLKELHRWVNKQTGRTDRPMSADLEEELPEGVIITFADRNAAQIRFEDGRVEVTLHVSQLVTPGKRLKNFAVKASYEPGSEGVDATLVRKDAVSLKGRKKINLRGQIVLRGIFGKVFSKNRPIHLLGQQITSRPGLENVTITQLVVRNGWIGMAIGPHRDTNVKPRPVVARIAK